MLRAMKQLLFTTSNQHKLAELRAILAPLQINVLGLDALPEPIAEPEEDGDSFEENARIKAIAYARASGLRCLAEDSGLAVDALGGAPGVHSARYAGSGGDREARDRANNQKLLAEIQQVPMSERTARFVCAMCVADPDGQVVAEASGYYAGLITSEPKGENGFGYDPLLFLPELGCTSAELSPAQKNARSHRGMAARELLKRLALVQD